MTGIPQLSRPERPSLRSAPIIERVAVLQLWWGITEQTYLYYWHHKVWAVVATWALAVLLVILIVLTGEELWRAGYRSALRSVAPPPVQAKRSSTPASPEKRRFLAPPSQAFPGIRGMFSRQEGNQDQITD